nr:EOG090X0EO1 [Leptodora kindtii]
MSMQSEIERLRREILRKNLNIKNTLQDIQSPETTEESLFSLNSVYRSEYKALRQLVDEFEKIVNENDEDGEFKEDIELYKGQLTSLQSSFRKSNIQTQTAINMKNKSELFYSNVGEMEIHARKSKGKDELVKMAKSTTANLSSISQLLANTVEQSRTTLEVLAQSSQTITDTNEEYKVMGSAIQSTKKLVSRYARRETTDMILIVLSGLLFFSACIYVITKRMF